MADLQGTKKVITEMAAIYTERQFAKLMESDPGMCNRKYVRLESVQVRGKLCGEVVDGPLSNDSIAVIPDKCSAFYLAFLLCSLPGQFYLFGKKLNVLAESRITRKAVSSLTVYDVEKSSERAYAVSEVLREKSYSDHLKDPNDLNKERLYFLISDLCDMLALELYAHPLFEEKEIFILENWKKALSQNLNEMTLVNALMALSDSNSKLRNEIMKAHILVYDVSAYLK